MRQKHRSPKTPKGQRVGWDNGGEGSEEGPAGLSGKLDMGSGRRVQDDSWGYLKDGGTHRSVSGEQELGGKGGGHVVELSLDNCP